MRKFELAIKKILPLFLLILSLNSYSETYVCSHIVSWTIKMNNPTIVTNKLIRDGNIFQRPNVQHIYEIYHEDDKFLILDANFGLIGETIFIYIDKETRDYVYSSTGIGRNLNIYEKGKCEVIY